MNLALAAGCGTNGAGTSTTADNGSGGNTVAASPASVPPPAGVVVRAASLSGEVAINDNFNTNDGLQPAYGTGVIPAASPDAVSGFRFMCKPGQILRDDPIVYPGQAGAS